MLYMSFFGHLEHVSQPPESGWVPHGALVGIIGVLFALALAGLVATLATGRLEAEAGPDAERPPARSA
jgi:hypothetical protein